MEAQFCPSDPRRLGFCGISCFCILTAGRSPAAEHAFDNWFLWCCALQNPSWRSSGARGQTEDLRRRLSGELEAPSFSWDEGGRLGSHFIMGGFCSGNRKLLSSSILQSLFGKIQGPFLIDLPQLLGLWEWQTWLSLIYYSWQRQTKLKQPLPFPRTSDLI